MRKKSKAELKRDKKNDFLSTYAPAILAKYYPKVKLFQHFIKVEIDGFECDYYPGAEKMNVIKDGKNNWSSLSHKDYLDHLQIDLDHDDFSSREEVIGFADQGLFNGDLD